MTNLFPEDASKLSELASIIETTALKGLISQIMNPNIDITKLGVHSIHPVAEKRIIQLCDRMLISKQYLELSYDQIKDYLMRNWILKKACIEEVMYKLKIHNNDQVILEERDPRTSKYADTSFLYLTSDLSTHYLSPARENKRRMICFDQNGNTVADLDGGNLLTVPKITNLVLFSPQYRSKTEVIGRYFVPDEIDPKPEIENLKESIRLICSYIDEEFKKAGLPTFEFN